MKKITLLLLAVPLLFFACKKNKDVVLIIGETEGYEITNHSLSAQGFDDGPTYNGEFVDIDLNNDGAADIRFLSFQDSVNSPELAANYWIDGKVLNSQFTVLENPGSDEEYELFTTEYDYFGTYPRKTAVVKSYCENVEGGVYNNDNLRTAKIFKQLDKVNKDEVFEAKYNLSAQSFEIYEEHVQESYWEFNADNDSLIGRHNIPMNTCRSAPYDEDFFIAFKYDSDAEVRYGWIQLIVTENNKIIVNFSGISEM
ncbi:MAG: hypothetical protein GQ574_28660 [Crocinitomix sp.]|nr:hypothetical protein [Crocinitomix sp.]